MLDTTTLLWGLLFSSIGLGYFWYGKKQQRKAAFYAGLGLMIYPYFVYSPAALIAVGLGLMALPWLLKY